MGELSLTLESFVEWVTLPLTSWGSFSPFMTSTRHALR